MRKSKINRATKETQIKLELNLDGTGIAQIDTGCGFLNHMMELFTCHSGCDLKIECKGDVQVDYHHTVEDIGICLGEAFKDAIGDKSGIFRYGDIMLPMDEVMMVCALDVSGRSCLVYNVYPACEKVGDFDSELVQEFFVALVRTSDITLHFAQLYGDNTHHVLEAVFKSFARALKQAIAIDVTANGKVPSSKGSL